MLSFFLFSLLALTHEIVIIPPVQEPIIGIVTAYTNSPDETDSTPNENAAGLKPAVWDVANNCLPFGTKVNVDGRIYTVHDRMNRRYGCEYYDIFTNDLQAAKVWGRQKLPITIL